MNVVIAIVITAGLSVLVGICYGNERYREGFNRGAAKEREAAEKDYNAGYSDGYRAGKEKGKKEALKEMLKEDTALTTIPYTNTILLHRTETLTLEEEHETRRSREELINWHTNHLYERLLNDAKRAIDITVKEPNATGETEIEGRLVVTLRG